MASQIAHVDALRTAAFGSITSGYLPLGTAFTHPMRLVRIINNTNGDLLFSFDTATDNIFCPANSFVLYDLTTNREESLTFFVFANGTQVYVKYSSAPTSGSVYLECIYGQGE